MTDQKQETGDKAVAIQSGRDTTIHTGMTTEQLHQIMETLKEYAQHIAAHTAREVAVGRMDDFERRLLERFTPSGDGDPDAFEDPDFQFLVGSAQRASGRCGDEQVIDNLVGLISERSREKNRGRLALALNEAVEVAPTLTSNEFAELSLAFLLKHTRNYTVVNINVFAGFFAAHIRPLLPDISEEASSYQYLDAQRCASVGLTAHLLENILHLSYGGSFCKGFTEEELRNHLPDGKQDIFKGSPFLIPSHHDSEKLQFDAFDRESALKALEDYDLEEGERENLANLFTSKYMNLKEIKEVLVPLIPDFATLADLWKNTKLQNLTLTSVGIAIGYSNLRRVTGFQADLSIWIK